MKIIFDYNRTIFNPDKQQLYAGALELISDLSDKHELFLVSKNEPGRQKVFESLNISGFFKKIVFVENKSIQIFKELIGEEDNTVVVGDRLRGEISIGNELNYMTVRVRQGKFSDEEPADEKQKPKHTVNNISELKEIIKLYE